MEITVVMCGLALGAGLVLLVRPSRPRRSGRLRQWLESAGLGGVPVPTVLLVLATVGTLVATAVAAVVPIPALTPISGIAGIGIPVVALLRARDARRVTARAAWPDIIDSIRVALRAGATVSEAFIAAESLVPRDWSVAWRNLSSDLRRGAPLEQVLATLRRALADPVADRVIESVLIGRELGGSELSVVLTELARAVRRDGNVRREVRARQSWVRNAARLGVAAPWVVLVLLASRPENREAYSTATGTTMIVAVTGVTVVSYAVMTALGEIREPRRWLMGSADG